MGSVGDSLPDVVGDVLPDITSSKRVITMRRHWIRCSILLMTVPTIGIRDITVPTVYVPNWLNSTPNVDHLVPPVVLNIGNPIINMLGCVKAHQDNQMHRSGLPKIRIL